MIKGDKTYLSINSSIAHILNLLVNSSLKTLHSTDISDILFIVGHKLLGSITKLHEFSHLFSFVTFELEFSLHWLWAAHRPTLINAEDNRDIFVSHHFLVLNLSSCLNDIVYCFAQRLLLFFDLYIVTGVTELAFPDLFLITFFRLNLFSLTVNVEAGLAMRAEDGVSCCNLCFVLKSLEFNLEYVCVELLSEVTSWPLPIDFLALLILCSEAICIFSVWEIEVSVELIWV